MTFEGFLSEQHVRVVCKRGTGESQCAYLLSDLLSDGCMCAKEFPFMKMGAEAGLLEDGLVGTGDNCSGPPDFTVGGKA